MVGSLQPRLKLFRINKPLTCAWLSLTAEVVLLGMVFGWGEPLKDVLLYLTVLYFEDLFYVRLSLRHVFLDTSNILIDLYRGNETVRIVFTQGN